ncbi:MAG: hypothetical protein ACRCU2_09705 [Planktothrix sp.]
MSLQENIAQEIISDAIWRLFLVENVVKEMDGENPEVAEILTIIYNDIKTNSHLSIFSRSMMWNQVKDISVDEEVIKESLLNIIKGQIENEKFVENLLKYLQKYET